jgi:hypothetical protein
VSQTLVGGRGVTTSKAGSQPIVKSTCSDCKRTVLLVAIGGQKVAMDPELIAVVPRKRNGEPERMTAHRVHKELCLSYQYEADKERRRKLFGVPPPRWRTIDNTKRSRSEAKRGSRTKGM